MGKNNWKTSEIVNNEVIDISGEVLGVLVDVLPTAGNDVWVIKTQNPSNQSKEILIPALKSIVRSVDIENKKIVVELPLGLKEIYED